MVDQSESNNSSAAVVVIGAGLAGSEAAWQVAQRGAYVTLYEMRPGRTTPAHETDRMAELVCSNSLGSNLPDRALGLLKNELRRLGSLIIACADRTAVPAGAALAVGREAFSRAVTEAIAAHPNITVRREEVTAIPRGVATIIASGPLTSAAAGRGDPRAGRARLPLFLRRDGPHRDRREHRHGGRVAGEPVGQGAGDRSQESGVRNQESGVRGQGPGGRSQGSGSGDRGSGQYA